MNFNVLLTEQCTELCFRKHIGLLGYDLLQFLHVLAYLYEIIDKLYHWVPPPSPPATSISTRHCRQGSTSTLMCVTGDHRLLANKAVIYGNLLTCDIFCTVHSAAAPDPSAMPSTVTSFYLTDSIGWMPRFGALLWVLEAVSQLLNRNVWMHVYRSCHW